MISCALRSKDNLE